MMFNKFSKDLDCVEQLRKDFVSDFPRDTLMNMTLEQYAMGHGDKHNFCYRLEYEQDGMGRISSSRAGSQKYGVWFDKKKGEYIFTKKYGSSVNDAFNNVKSEIIKLLRAGEDENFTIIEKSPIAELVKYKLLAVGMDV